MTNGHLRGYLVVYVILMLLLAATVGASFVNLGELNIVIAMAIALVKAALVMLIFMHVLRSGKLVWIFAASAFLWLGILIIGTFHDYGTRGRLPRSTRFDVQAAPKEVRHQSSLAVPQFAVDHRA